MSQMKTIMGTVKLDELSADEYHEALLDTVKAQVKAIMEESVTKKFVHEESEHVLRLCATIQTCLLDRLRKRTAGFLRTNKIANLFNKVGKSIPEVAQLIVKIEEAESAYESQSSDESKRANGVSQSSMHLRQLKQIWIRLALTEKLLDKIVEYLVENSSKFYEKQAILAHPVRGRILSSLLVGPCALEYTKMKTSDHYWSDPPADELLQRHKLHCRSDSSSSGRRPVLQSAAKYRSADVADKNFNSSADGCAFREYVESLHQNSKSTLLYGKNNVVIQPREELYPIPGYLSLHQAANSLYIKWTPNQLMNVNNNTKDVNCNHETTGVHDAEPDDARHFPNGDVRSPRHGFMQRKHSPEKWKNPLSYWEYAVSVNVRDVVYLHCHHRSDNGGTLVLVGQDGVQRPPICFPPGGHLLAFLTCLETGLLPHGHLDPPLWSQHGKGKVFPKLRNRSSHSSSSSAGSQSEAEEATDFVFRVTTGNSGTIYLPSGTDTNSVNESFDAYSASNYSFFGSQDSEKKFTGAASRSSLKVLCDTMRRQIISRAFYGWLAHCRHLSTVRTHLSALVLPERCELPTMSLSPIDQEVWDTYLKNGKIHSPEELMRHVYLGGIKHDMREAIWPYLLGHYSLESTVEDRRRSDIEAIQDYEQVMSEWVVVEKIVKQREKENLAMSLAKLSSGSPTSSISSFDGQVPPMLRKQSTLSDVFVSLEHDSAHVTSNPTEETIIEEEAVDHSRENGGTRPSPRKKAGLKDRLQKTHHYNLPHHADHTPYSSISTEPSFNDRRSSNVTVASISLDTHNSTDDVGLGDIHESDRENANCNGTSARSSCSDPESKSSSGRSPSLKKQAGIELQSSFDHVIEMEEDINENMDSNGYAEEGSVGHEHFSDSYPVGAKYTTELLETFGLNLHRIEKDVHRCDRNHEYFAKVGNLTKLRNIMCSYVWRHLDAGYMQGMCDLAAPLLIIMDDEGLVYSCFTQLMKRMVKNFPSGHAMDSHFSNMRSLLQILDSELFEHMHRNGDYTHFYFCYRWFLLDFKRELSYEEDVFLVWEAIWAARHVSSADFVLFFALALLHNYRDIILTNGMDFTDIIKFFNEMAERHDAKKILQSAQEFVYEVQNMISK